jgi:ADP-ribosylglycohydrolase
MTELRPLPADYLERVYAGVLGKIIGVYLGRPFEGWTYERIMSELGEIDRYVHEHINSPLVVTDDDITGTFTFVRALEDRGYDPDLTPAQIGESWLNYLIENRTILWWGGLGTSTEHTAYLRLKAGILAPDSGSIAVNGTTCAEQIGGQIFVDGWAMLFPGDPKRAADFAQRAASVSHDGAAIHGAQVVAAIEAAAFVENDLDVLLDIAVAEIPSDSIIARLIEDVRGWHAADDDWRVTRTKIADRYGYHRYPGVCHIVPNHALMIAALLHGRDDFARTMMIINTSGWDTDCNAGSVGAIMGVKNGLQGIDASAYDWRGPVADRLYLPCAEGGRAISDAATVAVRIARAGESLHGVTVTPPKDGARFHFSLPGSVQGFRASDHGATVAQAEGQLRLTLTGSAATVTTPTFIPTEALDLSGYQLISSPTLYPSQVIRWTIAAPARNQEPIVCVPLITVYGAADLVEERCGYAHELAPGQRQELTWTVPDLDAHPIQSFGFHLAGAITDALLVDWIDWRGAPSASLGRPSDGSTLWRRAWVNAVDCWESFWPDDFGVAQNEGTGLISQGDETWTDYEVCASVDVPLAREAGLAARVGGLRRYYALVLSGDRAQLVKQCDGRTVLSDHRLRSPSGTARLRLRVQGSTISGWVNDEPVGVITDDSLRAGAVGLLISEGTLRSGPVGVRPLD